jgi:hypothetical protein
MGTRSSIGIIFWGLDLGDVVVEDVDVAVFERVVLEKMVESFIFAVEEVD